MSAAHIVTQGCFKYFYLDSKKKKKKKKRKKRGIYRCFI
uniref:Uncharacterized protein n=1 Tax=Musa acuminata subsp. malaccensis TaxID=214687 RepID=A0A804K6L5_MUSAM